VNEIYNVGGFLRVLREYWIGCIENYDRETNVFIRVCLVTRVWYFLWQILEVSCLDLGFGWRQDNCVITRRCRVGE
jgi:hypothetical protein